MDELRLKMMNDSGSDSRHISLQNASKAASALPTSLLEDGATTSTKNLGYKEVTLLKTGKGFGFILEERVHKGKIAIFIKRIEPGMTCGSTSKVVPKAGDELISINGENIAGLSFSIIGARLAMVPNFANAKLCFLTPSSIVTI